MKKGIALLCIWLVVLGTGVIAKDSEGFAYTIYFDSETDETWPLQEEMQAIYGRMMQGINKESRYTMLVHNLSRFETKDVRARLKNSTLILTQGDGKGARISGRLANWKYCAAEVEPRSWLASLFS